MSLSSLAPDGWFGFTGRHNAQRTTAATNGDWIKQNPPAPKQKKQSPPLPCEMNRWQMAGTRLASSTHDIFRNRVAIVAS